MVLHGLPTENTACPFLQNHPCGQSVNNSYCFLKMAIYDKWDADYGYSIQGEELDLDATDWAPPDEKKVYTLRLEELTQYDISERVDARERNMFRLSKASQRSDIAHLEVHHTCLVDKIQREALEALLTCDGRVWQSFTLQGINGLTDLYSRSSSMEDFSSVFMALRTVKVLNLHSCTLNRGHGLEDILKTIPFLVELRELRLQGWQMDEISVSMLSEALREQKSKAVTLLSLRSCCFLGEETFDSVMRCICENEQLCTLNLSYCHLRDNDILPLIQALKKHPNLTSLHIGGNSCISSESVRAISEWIEEDSCRLIDLNLRALWVGYSEEGLLQRTVDLSGIFQSLARNLSIRRLTLSENYLEDEDMERLQSVLTQKDNLNFLDLGDNPFTEKAARVLLYLIQKYPSIESVRFENHYQRYRCADEIKPRARFNYVDRRLQRKSVDIPLQVWPHALARVQKQCSEKSFSEATAADVILRLLQEPTGNFGLPLSFRIATS